MTRAFAMLTIVRLTLTDRMREIREDGDRGSETTEKVLWIAFLVLLVAGVYAIFQSKIITKITGITL
ncbi:hypothetical protein EDC02_7756 [Micromonospora sp. Llam0]|uniref:hypothetical protein n=1 Tax=Micromonospora sp. Llam0 TaxID=2485143 RepID=UPI000F491B7F|nr:hypothetical protein [Micromonospora sp. Llam0]ROO52812.1 hypothetical protein EDC02_7756 [Micromonospora sp. Llam0]